MTEAEVRELLGAPLRTRGGTLAGSATIWDYGCVEKASQLTPVDLTFSIWLESGKVLACENPFDGAFSPDGSPTPVRLITPHGGDTFDQYPRIMDLRWYPASGEYPMSYEIQVDAATGSGWSSHSLTSAGPFISTTFKGQNNGRWRVRARNRLGYGPWSDYRSFRFTR